MKTFSDEFYLETAYKEALKAYKHNEIPVGAVIVDNATHKIIAKSYNKKEKKLTLLGRLQRKLIIGD